MCTNLPIGYTLYLTEIRKKKLFLVIYFLENKKLRMYKKCVSIMIISHLPHLLILLSANWLLENAVLFHSIFIEPIFVSIHLHFHTHKVFSELVNAILFNTMSFINYNRWKKEFSTTTINTSRWYKETAVPLIYF